jgi:uncharacterized membrane-anchored protein YhcB (DUF1043 family)
MRVHFVGIIIGLVLGIIIGILYAKLSKGKK